jgi:hypothetical protein
LIVSQPLKEAISELATCLPEATWSSSSDLEMDAPYHFLYHHRRQIAELLESGEEQMKKHVALLHDFLERNYGEEYSEADEQFNNGIVSKKHFHKLFRPNQVIIRQAKGIPMARVLHEWPFQDEEDESKIYLSSWVWDFDGRRLARNVESATLQLGGKGSARITQLEFYPSKYASQDTIQKLIDRGRKFWNMRGKYFACYSGWDAHHDQFYVSCSHRVHIMKLLNKVDKKPLYD